MGAKSRRGGAAFERRVACILREWLGDDWKVVRNGNHRQGGGAAAAGEFTISHALDGAILPLAVECKSRRAPPINYARLFEDFGELAPWWEQATEQAGELHMPLLVFWSPRKPVLCAARALDVPQSALRGSIDLEAVGVCSLASWVHSAPARLLLWGPYDNRRPL